MYPSRVFQLQDMRIPIRVRFLGTRSQNLICVKFSLRPTWRCPGETAPVGPIMESPMNVLLAYDIRETPISRWRR